MWDLGDNENQIQGPHTRTSPLGIPLLLLLQWLVTFPVSQTLDMVGVAGLLPEKKPDRAAFCQLLKPITKVRVCC